MKKLRLIDLYLIPTIILTLVAVVLRSFALLNCFNTDRMHFDDKFAVTVSYGIILLLIAGCFTYMFFGEKKSSLIARSDNIASYIPAGILSIGLLFIGVQNLNVGLVTDGRLGATLVISGILAFISILSFFLTIIIEKNESFIKSLFSLSVVLFLALYASMLFFNTTKHPTNSPNKIIDQLAYVFASLFFLQETRISLGRAKWRSYVSFGLIATVMTAYSSLPALITYATSGYVVSDSIIESVVTLLLCVFIFSKVLQTKSFTENSECSEAHGIVMLARMREEEIENQRKLSRTHAIDNNEGNDDAEDASNYTFDIPYVENAAETNPDDASIDLSNEID